jgi:tight adherence protein C
MLTTLLLVLAAAAIGFALIMLAVGIHNVFITRVVEAAKSEAVEEEEKGRVAKGLKALVFRRMGRLNRGLIGHDYRTWIGRQIVTAGDPGNVTVDDLVVMQELSTLGFFVAGLILHAATHVSVAWIFIFAITGVVYPLVWLRDKVRKRQMAIVRALPYNLDLMTLAVEAGLDFQAAVGKVVEKGKQGPFVDELKFMLAQLRMGKTREESLKIMASRVNLPSVSAFVNALIQADRMGASLGRVLRIQATQLRNERSARAEKLANEAPVKMLFPLIFCIFPTVFLVLFGPIVYQFLFGGIF